MKNFKLLLKNSMKSLWNSRVLVAQFTTLTTIATVVISSVSLGNFSLRNSMAKVYKESNANGFSIENKKVEDFASYNLISNSQKLVNSIDELKVTDATIDTKAYNPLSVSKTLTMGSIGESSYSKEDTYGFFQTYSVKYLQDLNTSDLENEWANLAFSKMGEALSIIIQNINGTNSEIANYKTELFDIFTLYNDILPPSPDTVKSTKYEIFFNQNIYSFNPWSLFIDVNDNNQMKVNNFGLVKVDGFNSKEDINTNITFNHGLFDSLYSFIVGTNLTFFDDVSPYQNEISKINDNIPLSTNWNDIYANNWKQPSSTLELTRQSFEDLIIKLNTNRADYETYLNNWYSQNYFNFLNVLSNDLKENFMKPTKAFKFNYSINVNESTGLSKFISEIYSSSNTTLKDKIFLPEDKKYFSGSLEIPLIPFITILPINKNLDAEQTRLWASDYNNFIDPNQSKVNMSNLKTILKDTFNELSRKSNIYFYPFSYPHWLGAAQKRALIL
ncbi:MAG: hypothetical protein K2I49_00650, partial [Ureaplasma sp.]|nr:hypothetical protein [Ureaplasma sp.]